jgi:hypothetical protein
VLVLPIEDVPFPVAGTYIFQLTLGDDVIPLAPLHLIADPEI